MANVISLARRPSIRRLGLDSVTIPSICAIRGHPFSIAAEQRYPDTTTAISDALEKLRPLMPYVSPTKPPSARPAETRKSQLIRTYTSLLRTTPLILFFQHSNLTAVEWAAVRRELNKALENLPPSAEDLTYRVQMQVLRTNMFKVALKIVEFYKPHAATALQSSKRTPQSPTGYDLSEAAFSAIRSADIPANSSYAQIEPLMVGPLAALVLPAVSPAHLAAALSVLSPIPGKFPMPTRRKSPGYHDATCQSGLAKLLLVGGRIEGKIFDQDGVNFVGGIEGGLASLRAQIVGILQGAGLGISSTLEGGGLNMWLALEGRRAQLEKSETDS